MSELPLNVIAALRGSHQLGIFFRLALEPEPLRLWLGVNDIPAGIASVDPTTQETYLGGGILQDVPMLEAVLNGVADRAEFIISGVDPATMARWNLDDIKVRGKAFHVGITTLDDYYQPMSPIIPMTTGRASRITEAQPPVTGTDSPTVTLALSVGFGITTRDRTSQALWSSPHHKAAHPGDRFCDGTARMERGAPVTWPKF
ncbi:MAG: hypothetical protein ACTHNH_08415 [Mesorhizobium sp.]